MTAISAGPTPPAVGPMAPANGAPATAASGGSFADTLLALVDRAIVEAPGAPDDRFASGTMRSAVEAFNQRGFFEDRAATDPRDPAASLASESPGVPEGGPQPASPPATLPPLQSDPLAPPLDRIPPVSPPVTLPVGILASDPGAGDRTATAGSSTAGSRPSAVPYGSPGASVPLASSPRPRVGALETTLEGSASPEGPGQAALRRDAGAFATSRVKVSLDHHDAGVAVSVVADLDPDADTGAIHEAVSHLLARHGLVLSDLRVTRRPGGGGQDRKD